VKHLIKTLKYWTARLAIALDHHVFRHRWEWLCDWNSRRLGGLGWLEVFCTPHQFVEMALTLEEMMLGVTRVQECSRCKGQQVWVGKQE
jgi:hypothetical protein